MKSNGNSNVVDGLIPRFKRVAAVPAQGRNLLKPRTVETYVAWIKCFFRFVRKPASQWAAEDIEAFMWEMHRREYSLQSRKQALCALIFVFRHVICREVGKLKLPQVPRQNKLVRDIPSREELVRIFTGLRGQVKLMAGLLFGAGLRVSECCELRMKDVDLDARTIRVHGGKGDKDRLTILPELLVGPMNRQMRWRAQLHESDLRKGWGLVKLPGRLALKYRGAPRELRWQFVFPSQSVRFGYRWFATTQGLQKAMKRAVNLAGILKRVTPHTLRHAFCTFGLQDGTDAATMQALMGHDDLNTTTIYAHADRARGRSPLDGPAPVRPRCGELAALRF